MNKDTNEFDFVLERPADGKGFDLIVSLSTDPNKAPSYSKTIHIPEIPHGPSLLDSIKNGKVFQLHLRSGYGPSALEANSTYDIQFISPDKWMVHGIFLDQEKPSGRLIPRTRVCTHSVFRDHKNNIKPVNITEHEFGIWGGIMKYKEIDPLFGRSDDGPINLKVSIDKDQNGKPIVNYLSMEPIRDPEPPRGECTYEKLH